MQSMASDWDAPLLLTVKQASARLGIPRTALYALLTSGALTSVKIGRLRRVPSWAIDQYVRRLVEEQADPPESLLR